MRTLVKYVFLFVAFIITPFLVATAADPGTTSTSTASSYGYGNLGNWSQTFEASKTPYMPGVVTGPVTSPSLFNMTGRSAQVAGLTMLSRNYFVPDINEVTVGKSGRTKIIYSGSILPKRRKIDGSKVEMDFSGAAVGEVVGALTIQSRKDRADDVDFMTLLYDAVQYMRGISGHQGLKGYKTKLLSSPDVISWSNGAETKSGGFSLSPVISSLLNLALLPANSLVGVSTGFSNTSGVTALTSMIGTTFLVVIESENGKKIIVNNNTSAITPASDMTKTMTEKKAKTLHSQYDK
jgi:hypothetical protein